MSGRPRQPSRSSQLAVVALTVSAIVTTVDLLSGGAGGLVWATLAVVLLAQAVFIVWFRLAFIQAARLAPNELEGLGSGWAIGAWFVPLVNLAFPFIIARRIWAAFAMVQGLRREPPAYFAVWWASLVLATLMAPTSREAARLFAIVGSIAEVRVVLGVTRLSRAADSIRGPTEPDALPSSS